jgi:hypothetical protein
MKINLNSPDFDQKKFLTKENILEDLDDYSIFRNYVGDFTVGSIRSSPFRKDNTPSFGIFYSKGYNCLMYKDLAKGTSGDCFSLVAKEVHPTYTYLEAMAQVVVDFGLRDRYVLPRAGFIEQSARRISYDIPDYKNTSIKPIGISARKYTTADYKYWGSFGIGRETLRTYNVVPISHFTYGNTVFKADELAFAYIERKDGLTTYKIYQPYSNKIKFFTDMDASIHAGYTQLPEKGELLLITKSLKDVMSIRDVTNIPAVSVLSETILAKESVIDEYKSRFNTVLVFFDNDKAGKNMAVEYFKTFKLEYIYIPNYFEHVTDFSDLVFVEGEEIAKNVLDTTIWLAEHKERDDLPF